LFLPSSLMVWQDTHFLNDFLSIGINLTSAHDGVTINAVITSTHSITCVAIIAGVDSKFFNI